MATQLIDNEAILSGIEQWKQLEDKWGTPVDLDTEDYVPEINPAYSHLDLGKTTFDSPFLIKKRKLERNLSTSILDYQEFVEDLNCNSSKAPEKEFYFINGQIMSAKSVEELCDNIDEIFRSVEILNSATSTIRARPVKRIPIIPDVDCSISTTGLSFDNTIVDISEKEKGDTDDVDLYIDEVFLYLNSTFANLECDQSIKESINTLVRRFSDVLENPVMKCNPRRRRECCDRFKELAEFWQKSSAANGQC